MKPMGFFDKVKTFAGGASMQSIEFVEVERQDPRGVSVPGGDTGVKGKFRVTCNKACTVLGHIDQLRTRCQAKDGEIGTVQVSDESNASNEVTGRDWQFPLDMKPGDAVDMWFMLYGDELGSYYAKYGVPVGDPSVEFFIKVTVDVKGSPFDPEAELTFKVTP